MCTVSARLVLAVAAPCAQGGQAEGRLCLAQAVQEHRTVQDSSGHRQTTVTRRSGHQAFITTTREDGQGKQCQEQVVNMDDRECGTEWAAGLGTPTPPPT